MTAESIPPMRQIAELIDGIATARAESAERLLGECETQLIEARLGEKAAFETIADRDAEIARLKAELAETRADLASLQCALFATPEQLGGHVKTAAPPAEDPRIAALCYLILGLGDIQQIPRTHHADSKSLAAYRVIAPEDAAFWAERRASR